MSRLVIFAAIGGLLLLGHGSGKAETALDPLHPPANDGHADLAAVVGEQQRAIELATNWLGADDPQIGLLQTKLGRTLLRLGRRADASAAFERALVIWETDVASAGAARATTLNDLALLRYEQGNIEDAASLLRQALGIWLRTVGLDHAHTRVTLDNLAAVYRAQGRAKDTTPDALDSLLANLARETRLELEAELVRAEGGVATAKAAVATQVTTIDRLRDQLATLERTSADRDKAGAEQLAKAEGEAATLRAENDDLNRLLASTEARIDEQQDQIDGVDERLSQALAVRVEELEQYRSEFFGQLKRVLGDRPDLRIVGDRFVFQSELLFASSSVRLDPAGQAQLRELARTLQDVAARIPPGLNWVLRVDGHTDRQPIRDGSFRSNWELSAARAISVIEFLIAQGIPPDHLAATGFGGYRPIDPTDDEVAYRRNRRIEFKLENE